MLGDDGEQQEEYCYDVDEDIAAGIPRSVETGSQSCETKKFDTLLHISPIDEDMRSGRVFVGLDMSKEDMRTTSHAE